MLDEDTAQAATKDGKTVRAQGKRPRKGEKKEKSSKQAKQHRQVLKRYGKRGKGYQAPDNAVIKTLKAFHLLAATAWAGGALSMQALGYLKITAESEAVRQMAASHLHFVDTVVVIPGLIGCLLTGLIYSTMTSIGFFKFFWIGVKWVVACCAGFWGGMFWGPWGDKFIALAATHGLDAPLRFVRGFILPENMWQGALQICTILFMCLISVYRPRTIIPRKFRKKTHEEEFTCMEDLTGICDPHCPHPCPRKADSHVYLKK